MLILKDITKRRTQKHKHSRDRQLENHGTRPVLIYPIYQDGGCVKIYTAAGVNYQPPKIISKVNVRID